MKTNFICDMTPWELLQRLQPGLPSTYFLFEFPEDKGSKFVRNVGKITKATWRRATTRPQKQIAPVGLLRKKRKTITGNRSTACRTTLTRASYERTRNLNTFTAIVDLSRFNNSCLKSPASTLVDLTFQSRALRSFSLNQLLNLSL